MHTGPTRSSGLGTVQRRNCPAAPILTIRLWKLDNGGHVEAKVLVTRPRRRSMSGFSQAGAFRRLSRGMRVLPGLMRACRKYQPWQQDAAIVFAELRACCYMAQMFPAPFLTNVASPMA